jgi:hypothetical protein
MSQVLGEGGEEDTIATISMASSLSLNLCAMALYA